MAGRRLIGSRGSRYKDHKAKVRGGQAVQWKTLAFFALIDANPHKNNVDLGPVIRAAEAELVNDFLRRARR